MARRCSRLLLAAVFVSIGGCADFRLPDPAVLYVAFGDSATAGPSGRDYSDALRGLLGVPEEAFANEGRGSEAAVDGLDRLELLLVNGIFPNAEVLIYWEGGNDLADFIRERDPFLVFAPNHPDYPFTSALERELDETQSAIESAIDLGQGAGMDVFVATYYFVQEGFGVCQAFAFDVVLPEQARTANEYLLLLNERIRAAAADRGATLVDVAAVDDTLRADADNYHDCNHLSATGNAIVAEVFFEKIGSRRSIAP